MNNITILLAILPLLPLGFWLWMAWDFSGNNDVPERDRFYWQLAFLFTNVFAAMYYYVTIYRKRH
ncbi:hypothetical protein [Dictyobacter aurantiacus]|uniref:Cardiolipin synthase N-terminal domain-containing protein n=1 Tax=Dictyobacter aurantiacus TaxID=1936993 RepID=A0A401ZMY7_9CHLR|nr:hypothetical protein [Dictyobacter aurantiacus]GCE08213.1 hypothetical protein KDAU_55420 [Dictyobacter aurantiacus]